MNASTYAVFAKMGANEGFIAGNNALGPLSGAMLFETLAGAKKRADTWKGVVVEVETRIRGTPDVYDPEKFKTLFQAVAMTEKEFMKEALAKATEEDLLRRLKELDGADKVLSDKTRTESKPRRM